MHELVDDIVGSWIHQPGRHDLQRVNGAAFLWQAELCAGPEADQHVAASDHAFLNVVLEAQGQFSIGFCASIRHF